MEASSGNQLGNMKKILFCLIPLFFLSSCAKSEEDIVDDLGQLSGGGDLDITDGIEAGRLLQGDLQNFLGLSCGVGVVVFHGKILLKIFDLVLRSLV